MAIIKNKLNQRILINLIGGKNIDLLARGRADVPQEELSSPHLQSLMDKGSIKVVQEKAGIAQKAPLEKIEKKKPPKETQKPQKAKAEQRAPSEKIEKKKPPKETRQPKETDEAQKAPLEKIEKKKGSQETLQPQSKPEKED